jgi:hypothetical protein
LRYSADVARMALFFLFAWWHIGLATAATCALSDGICWGTPVRGLKLGLGVNSASEPTTLRVLITNEKSWTQVIQLGIVTGQEVQLAIRLQSINPAGK